MNTKFLYIFFLLSAQSLLAQVTFKATVSKTQLGLNERLRIEYSIDKQGGDDFTPPNFNEEESGVPKFYTKKNYSGRVKLRVNGETFWVEIPSFEKREAAYLPL